MAQFKIFDLQRALEPKLGMIGARQQILTALRVGNIHAVCDKFMGINPRAYSSVAYPEKAEKFSLPSAFWAPSTWLHDGEQVLSTDSRGNHWTTLASWVRGDFAISGAFSRGSIPVVRRATGVEFGESVARAFVAKYSTGGSTAGNLLTPEEVLDWCISWLKQRTDAKLPCGQDFAEPQFFADNPGNPRKVFRPAFKDAKGRLGL